MQFATPPFTSTRRLDEPKRESVMLVARRTVDHPRLWQEAKLEGQQARLKRYEDYLKGSSPAADPEADEINDLLNRCFGGNNVG